MKNENFEMCKSIAHEVEAYAEGNVYRCPECGETFRNDTSAFDPETETYTLPCGCSTDEEPEQLSLYDYFEDLLDIDWILNSQKEYKACRILVAFGGPNIYIDTLSGYVELYWWNETARYKLLSETVSAIDEWAEEWWNC